MKVYFSWSANSEPEVTGYKIYAGTATGTYNLSNSPRDVGNVTSGANAYFDISTFGSALYFALTAYTATDESSFSTELQQTFSQPVVMLR